MIISWRNYPEKVGEDGHPEFNSDIYMQMQWYLHSRLILLGFENLLYT